MTDEPEPRRHIGNLIRRAQQLHAALWARAVSDEISSLQYGVLAVLERREGASQKEVGDEVSLDRSTIAELVGRMARSGLLARVRDEGDRRRNALTLTEAGRGELERLRPRVERLQATLTGGLDDGDERELRRLLQRVLQAESAAQPPTTSTPAARRRASAADEDSAATPATRSASTRTS